MKHLARILPVLVAVLFFVTTIEKKGSFDITESTSGYTVNAGGGAGKVIFQD